MVARQKSLRAAPWLATLLASAWVAACVPEASPAKSSNAKTGGAGGSTTAGPGGASGSGGTTSGSGGSGGSGSGGAPVGSGGSGTAGGGGSASSGGAGGSTTGSDAGRLDTGSPGAADAAADVGSLPFAAVPHYAQCSVCHGPEGAGTTLGPEIQHPVIDFATWVVRNGRMHPMYMDPMPKYAPAMLTDVQMQEIFTYLSSRAKPTTGPALYKDYCQNCHGADAKGGVTMRTIATQAAAAMITNVRGGHHPGEFMNRREYMPKWTATELSDAEIRLIATHVAGL